MEIIRHLSHEELADLAIESDQQALRPTLEALPDWARASTGTSRGILAGAAKCRLVTNCSAGIATIGCGSPLADAGMVGGGGTWSLLAGLLLDRAPVVPPHEAQVDPDHELLMAVERAVHNRRAGGAGAGGAAGRGDGSGSTRLQIPRFARRSPAHEN